MSFRIEEKLYIKEQNLIEFKDFISKKSPQKLFTPRKIESLYFDNVNLDMYNDSVEGIVPRKKNKGLGSIQILKMKIYILKSKIHQLKVDLKQEKDRKR